MCPWVSEQNAETNPGPLDNWFIETSNKITFAQQTVTEAVW